MAMSSNPEVATTTVAAATITIRAVASGVATITVSASDPEGGAARQTVQVIVPNREPQAVGTIPERTLSVGETAMVDVSSYFSDPDGDTLSYTAASSNAGVAEASVSGSSVVIAALARGVVTVTVTARDPRGLVAQQRFQLTVPNRAPEAVEAIPAQTVFAGQAASVDGSLYFRDPDGDPLTYTATSSNPEVATATVAAATITIRAIAPGVATITVSASDPEGGAARQTVQVIVPNREPQAVGTISERTLSVGETEMVNVSSYFTDPDGDTLSYTAASSNAGVAEASVSGSSVVIAALARGVVTVTVTAHDPRGLAAQQRFQLTVPNRAPEAVDAIPARTVFAGHTASVDASIYFRDPDGDPFTYTATSSNPEVATTTVAAATITIRAVAPGVATVTVNASDPAGGAAQQSVQVIVPNREPEAVGEILARTVSAGERAAVDVSPYFSDPDGDKLSYTAASSNAGVVVAEVSGDSVVVTSLARGVAIVTVTARDPRGLAAQQRFQVTVANRAPEAVGEIPAQAVSAGETATVDVSPYFSEPDGDALSYTASSSNAGVARASVSGGAVVVGALAGGLATVTVTARDPQGLAAQQRFQVTVPSRAPEAVGAIPAQAVPIGGTATVDLSPYFSDPDGDELSYDAASSNTEVVEVSVTGSSVVVAARARGVATVTVTARDPGGLSASSPFAVTVEIAEGRFRIELVFVTSVTRAQRAAFVRAAARWMTILAPTELPDARVNRTLDCGDDPRFDRYVETIDDLMIVAAVDEIDGPGGTLAQAGACWRRAGTLMPLYGRMEFDVADLERLEQRGTLEDVVLHEMGHVLGIGTIWSRLGLLRDPASETEAPDTHFTGPLAIEAFDEAGGTGYRGAKVPVENMGGPGSRVMRHWRETVLSDGTHDAQRTRSGVPEPVERDHHPVAGGPRLRGRSDGGRPLPTPRRRRRAGHRSRPADSVRGRHLERSDRRRRPGRTDRARDPGFEQRRSPPLLAVIAGRRPTEPRPDPITGGQHLVAQRRRPERGEVLHLDAARREVVHRLRDPRLRPALPLTDREHLAHLPRAVVGRRRIADQSLDPQFLERGETLFHGHVIVGKMQIMDVEIVGPQPPRRGLDPAAPVSEDFAENLLGAAAAVDVRGVAEIRPRSRAQVDHRTGGVDVRLGPEGHRPCQTAIEMSGVRAQ